MPGWYVAAEVSSPLEYAMRGGAQQVYAAFRRFEDGRMLAVRRLKLEAMMR